MSTVIISNSEQGAWVDESLPPTLKLPTLIGYWKVWVQDNLEDGISDDFRPRKERNFEEKTHCLRRRRLKTSRTNANRRL